MGNTLNDLGKPTFNSTPGTVADLTALANYIDKYAHVVVGTHTARLNAASATLRQGMLWVETDTGQIWRRGGGTSWFLASLPDEPWTTLTALNDWTANTGAGSPQVSRVGKTVSFRGGVFGGTPTNRAFLLPEWCGVSRTTRINGIMSSGNTDIVRARIEPIGDMFLSAATSTECQFSWSYL